MKFRIEMRKDDSKDEFSQIYEGNENNYLVNNINKKTNYEIRICSIYKDIISNWTNIHKVLIDDIKNMKDAKEEPKKEEKPQGDDKDID